MRRRSRLSPRHAYYLVTSLNWFATVLPMAVMVLLAQARGIGLAEIGLYMGLYALVVVALEVPSGALSDTIGRKRTYLLGAALNLAARVVFLLAFDLWAFMAFAVVLGISRALSSGALEAWFVDALQAEDADTDLQPALATAGSYQLAGLALGTLVGGALPALFAWLPTEGILTPLATPVLASALLQGVVLLVVALVIDERGATATASAAVARPVSGTAGAVLAHIKQAFETVINSPRLRVLLLVDVVIGVALAASENLWQPFFAGLLPGDDAAELAAGGGTIALGVLLGGSFAVGIFGNLLATNLARLLGKRQALVAMIFLIVQGIGFVALALSGAFLPAAALFWFTYLTRAGWSSPHQTLYNREVSSEQRSVMLSVQSLAFFGGSFLGSVVLGWVAGETSIAGAWLVAGGALSLSSLLYLGLYLVERRQLRISAAPGCSPSPRSAEDPPEPARA